MEGSDGLSVYPVISVFCRESNHKPPKPFLPQCGQMTKY